MRSKTIFGALLVSVALCSQGFGYELLDRMLGLNSGGCGDCNACANVACCDKACAKACCPEPACCEQACCEPACCEQACGGKCKRNRCRATPVRDLFAGLVDLFECKGSYCEPVCEPACEQACESACCENVSCCKKKCRKRRGCKKNCCEKACDPCCPATCEEVAACDPTCEPACEPACKPKCHKLYRRPVIELLEALFGGRKCGCGGATCGDGCETACGGGSVVPATNAPMKAPEKAAPLPMAPKADPSAAIHTRGIYQASRSLVRN